MDGEKPTRLQYYTRTSWQLRKADSGRNRPLQERAHQLVIQYQMVSPKKMYVNGIVQNEFLMSGNICVYTYTHVATMKRNRGHEFAREQGRSYSGVWREDREGRNYAIILNYIKISKIKIKSMFILFYMYVCAQCPQR